MSKVEGDRRLSPEDSHHFESSSSMGSGEGGYCSAMEVSEFVCFAWMVMGELASASRADKEAVPTFSRAEVDDVDCGRFSVAEEVGCRSVACSVVEELDSIACSVLEEEEFDSVSRVAVAELNSVSWVELEEFASGKRASFSIASSQTGGADIGDDDGAITVLDSISSRMVKTSSNDSCGAGATEVLDTPNEAAGSSICTGPSIMISPSMKDVGFLSIVSLTASKCMEEGETVLCTI